MTCVMWFSLLCLLFDFVPFRLIAVYLCETFCLVFIVCLMSSLLDCVRFSGCVCWTLISYGTVLDCGFHTF